MTWEPIVYVLLGWVLRGVKPEWFLKYLLIAGVLLALLIGIYKYLTSDVCP